MTSSLSDPTMGILVTRRHLFRFASLTGHLNGHGSDIRVPLSAVKFDVVRIPLFTLPIGGIGYGTNAQE